MVNLKVAAEARRYWKSLLAQQSENGEGIDQAALKCTARAFSPQLDKLLADFHRDGVTAIEGYWNTEQCAAGRDELDRMIVEYPQCVRYYSNDSDKRVYGAETAGRNIGLFHDDVFLRSFGEIGGGFALFNLATLAARIDATKSNRGSGEGWHRDAFGYQFKAILYLSDVTDDNGPFEYLCGSQKCWRVALDSALGRFPVPPESRGDQDGIDRLIARGALKPRRFLAKAGTVILANTSGIHCGAPLNSGHRYALTNYYYYPHQIGKSLVDKFDRLMPGARDRLSPFLEKERLAMLGSKL